MTLDFDPKPVFGVVFSWASQASQYAPIGPAGISYERHYADGYDRGPDNPVDCLLFRDAAGELVGILNHYPEDHPGGLEQAGNINVWVRPDRQHRGIGSRLVHHAMKLWDVRPDQQRYTPAGVALLRSLDRKGVKP